MSKRNTNSLILGAGLALIVIAVILLLGFLMQGETTIEGGWTESKNTQSVTCTSNDTAYPFFTYDESNKKTMTAKMIFDDSKLSSISLVGTLYYTDANKIEKSANENHAALNLSTQAAGLGPDALNLKISKLDDSMKFSLYATAGDIDMTTKNYLMLDEVELTKVKELSAIKSNFTKKGFKCVENSN